MGFDFAIPRSITEPCITTSHFGIPGP
jgi:hypothetical protein